MIMNRILSVILILLIFTLVQKVEHIRLYYST